MIIGHFEDNPPAINHLHWYGQQKI